MAIRMRGRFAVGAPDLPKSLRKLTVTGAQPQAAPDRQGRVTAGPSWEAWAPPLAPPADGGLPVDDAQAIADAWWDDEPHLAAALMWEAYAATLPPALAVAQVRHRDAVGLLRPGGSRRGAGRGDHPRPVAPLVRCPRWCRCRCGAAVTPRRTRCLECRRSRSETGVRCRRAGHRVPRSTPAAETGWCRCAPAGRSFRRRCGRCPPGWAAMPRSGPLAAVPGRWPGRRRWCRAEPRFTTVGRGRRAGRRSAPGSSPGSRCARTAARPRRPRCTTCAAAQPGTGRATSRRCATRAMRRSPAGRAARRGRRLARPPRPAWAGSGVTSRGALAENPKTWVGKRAAKSGSDKSRG